MAGISIIRMKICIFSEYTFNRKGICDGKGHNLDRSGIELFKLCLNQNPRRSEGIGSVSRVVNASSGVPSSPDDRLDP